VPEVTLRSAIQAIDAAGGGWITFDIPDDDPGRDASTGAWVILPDSPLPAITVPANIDATSQPGYSGKPRIVLDGSAAGATASGLVLTASFSRIQGFAIDNFGSGTQSNADAGDGIVVAGSQNTIVSNFIGVDEFGTKAAGNANYGIIVQGSDDRIGGPSSDVLVNGLPVATGRNVISANSIGIALAGTGGNIVEGNYIGSEADSSTTDTSFGNPNGGIIIESGGNTIGGSAPEDGNLIQGASAGAAIDLLPNAAGAPTDANNIMANILGLLTGTVVLQTNGQYAYAGGNDFGVLVRDGAADVNIGQGSESGIGNIIAGNVVGIQIEGGSNTVAIEHNLIGAQPGELPTSGDLSVQYDPSSWDDAVSSSVLKEYYPPSPSTKESVLANDAGVAIATNAFSFSPLHVVIDDNEISGNEKPGVEFLSGLPNVEISGNTISFNGDGILFAAGVSPPSTGDDFLNNSIFGNDLGVESSGQATLPENYLSLPDFANHFLAAPEIRSIEQNGDDTVVNWSLWPVVHEPQDSYLVDFFATDPETIAGSVRQGEFLDDGVFVSAAGGSPNPRYPGLVDYDGDVLSKPVSRNDLITAMLQVAGDAAETNYRDTSNYSNAVPVAPPDSAVGPSGSGDQHFINDSDPGYTLVFENPATATAPAQTATITDQLDPNLDPSTFNLGAISVGGVSVVAPNGSQSFNTQLDLTATQGVLVNVSASFNTSTDTATWTFTSIDPKTGNPPTDPSVGFLPPNTDGLSGEVFVTYTVAPKSGLATGTVVKCQAQFSMDGGTPITTPVSFNTIDSGAPTSSVATLADVTNSTGSQVNWSGQDDAGGSGIATYNVYVSDNGGPFTLWQSATTATSAVYNGQYGHTYGFYSIATDNVGNVQATPSGAQATTKLQPPQLAVVSSQDPAAADRGGGQDSTTELYNAEGTLNLDDALPTSAETSTDGRYFVFTSSAPNLVPGMPTPNTDTPDFDTNGVQVYRYDRQTGTISLVSVNTAGGAGDNLSFDPVISADGRYVAFVSQADDLVPNFVPNPNRNFSTDNVMPVLAASFR
jgi:hypothetical protein